MATRKRNDYRPLGVSLRDFARGRIRAYVPGGDTIARTSLPPSWAAAATEPLGWDGPPAQAAPPAPPVQAAPAEPVDIDALVRGPQTAPVTASAPQAEPAAVRTPAAPAGDEARLKAILAAHEARRATAMTDSPPAVQRRAEAEAGLDGGTPQTFSTASHAGAPTAQAATSGENGVPAVVPRRRRGQVVDVTPPQPTGVFDERLWDSLPAQTAAAPQAAPTDDANEEADFFEQAAPDTTTHTGTQTAPDLASSSASAAASIQRSAEAAQRIERSEAPAQQERETPRPPGAPEGTPPAESSPPRQPPPATPQMASARGPAATPATAAVQRAPAPVDSVFGQFGDPLTPESPQAVAAPTDEFEALLAQAETTSPAQPSASAPAETPFANQPPAVPPMAATASPAVPAFPAQAESAALPQDQTQSSAAAAAAATAPATAAGVQRAAAPDVPVQARAMTGDESATALPQPINTLQTALQRSEAAPASVQRAEMTPASQRTDAASALIQRAEAAPVSEQNREAAPPPSQRADAAPVSDQNTGAVPPQVQRAAATTPPIQRAPDTTTGSAFAPSQPLSETDGHTAATQPIRPVTAASETQPIRPVSAAPDTQPNAPAEAEWSAPPSFRAAPEAAAETPDAQTLIQRAEAPAMPERTPDARATLGRTPDAPAPSDSGPAAKPLSGAAAAPAPPDGGSSGTPPMRPADEGLTALIQRAEAPSTTVDAPSAPARPAPESPAPPRAGTPAPAAAGPSFAPAGPAAAASASGRVQRTVEDAAEGTPAPPPEQAAAAEMLRAAESVPSGRNAPASGSPTGVATPAAPLSVQHNTSESAGETGRPTLPDAPTLLEPAAPQGLSSAIQRAIAAAEPPSRAADAPPEAPVSASEAAQPASASDSSTRPAPVVLDSRLTPSPWSSFMQAPDAKPEPAPRRPPPAPTPVQRAATPPPAPPPASSVTPPTARPAPPLAPDVLQRAPAEPEAALPLQEVDLAQALAQAERAAAPDGARSQAPPAPPTAPTSQTPSRTPPGVQRKTVSGAVVEAGGDQLPPPSVVPAPGSVEAAMLDLLNLPPDTSVYGLKSGGQSAPADGPGPAVQRMPLDQALLGHTPASDSPVVQRAQTEATDQDEERSDAGQGADEPDVEDLARKVYRLLKDKLRVERERSTR
jgi:hypothetical protein